MNYCFVDDLIPDEQFGFLPKRSTDWQLLHLLTDWHAALNAGQDIHALFVNISKAFDRVDHGLLQVKLEALGERGVELNWFTSYLENWHICTVHYQAYFQRQVASHKVRFWVPPVCHLLSRHSRVCHVSLSDVCKRHTYL